MMSERSRAASAAARSTPRIAAMTARSGASGVSSVLALNRRAPSAADTSIAASLKAPPISTSSGRAVGDDNIGVGARTSLVLVGDAAFGFPRGGYRGFLGRGLIGKDAQGRELVLDLLKSGQHGLAIVGDGGVQQGAVLFDNRVARPGIDDPLGQV